MSKREEVKKSIKNLIKQLHAGREPEEVKEKFKDVLKNTGPVEIAQAEEELIEEGMPAEEVRRLCDVHLAVFRERLDEHEVKVAPGHPVDTFMEEHKIISQFLADLTNVAENIKSAKDFESVREEIHKLAHVAEHLTEAEKHNVREENVLFPYLEKHGITQPPAVMWSEHNELREAKKKLHELVTKREALGFRDFVRQLEEVTPSLVETLSSHIYKENNILYPAALRTITKEEWTEIRKECDELGYCCFTPQPIAATVEEAKTAEPGVPEEGLIAFDTGSLPKADIQAVFNALPVDITFVDTEDTVRYFSKSKERIFPRTKAVIGRKVQQCHPQKSLHVVNRILNDFRSGRRDVAEFSIQKEGRTIHIRYFPVRDERGEYLGCLEVTQDITDIKKIEGEKRLLGE